VCSGDAELVAFGVCHGDPGVWALATVPQLASTAGDQPGDNLGARLVTDAKVEVQPVVPPFRRGPIDCWFVRFPLGETREQTRTETRGSNATQRLPGQVAARQACLPTGVESDIDLRLGALGPRASTKALWTDRGWRTRSARRTYTGRHHALSAAVERA